MTYYAAFIPGMQEVIASVLCERLDDVSIIKLLDGAVIFETACTYDRLNFFCFNNIFAVIDTLEQKNNRLNTSLEFLEAHIRKILAHGNLSRQNLSLMAVNVKSIKKFRLVCSVENKPAGISEKSRQDMERFIAYHSGLELDRRKGDTEFLLLSRSEGFSCFLKRLSGNDKHRAGELSPHLAWMLCRIAGLKHGEAVADPCCGYGSIANAACKFFPVSKVYASDIENRCVEITRSRPGLNTGRAQIFQADFRSLSEYIPEGTVDAIVTDPPWGMYKEASTPPETLYCQMCGVFAKLLKNGGRAIILTAAKKELENAVEKTQALTVNKTIPILVSGKKASVFVLGKNQLFLP